VRDLFCQVSDPRSTARGGRVSALPVSMAVHVAIVLAVVVIPLLASDVLPAIRGTDPSWMPTVAVPSPPPSPAPAVRRTAPLPSPDAPPVEAPNGIGRERMLATAQPLDVAAPDPGGTVDGGVLPSGFGAALTDAPPPVRPTAPVPVRTLLRPPVRIHDVSPVYPDAARLAHIQGVVIIEAVIGPTGEIQDARVLRSRPLLDDAALAAVRQWRYTPSLLNGVPVPVVMTVTVSFTLQ
jgi:periplasmic protein TonB